MEDRTAKSYRFIVSDLISDDSGTDFYANLMADDIGLGKYGIRKQEYIQFCNDRNLDFHLEASAELFIKWCKTQIELLKINEDFDDKEELDFFGTPTCDCGMQQ